MSTVLNTIGIALVVIAVLVIIAGWLLIGLTMGKNR